MGLSACSGGLDAPEMTAQALGQSISLTATAGAGSSLDAQANLQTAVAQGTASAASAAATQAAAAGQDAAAIAATATAEEPIRAELSKYGINPAYGRVAWVHPPAALSVTGYLQHDFVNDYIGTVAQNFVLSTDITWDTKTGLAGCGLVFRSNGNKESLSQYLVIATRGANGHVVFNSMLDGELQNAIDYYANGIDRNFNSQNGSTNRLTVVARGNTFTIFTNGIQVGQAVAGDQPILALPLMPTQPPSDASADQVAQFNQEMTDFDDLVASIQGNFNPNLAIVQAETPYFERGFVAMAALSESGTTNCQFNNTWLWLIER